MTTDSRPRRFGATGVATALAVVLGVILAGSAYALWSAFADFRGAAITAGDLRLTVGCTDASTPPPSGWHRLITDDDGAVTVQPFTGRAVPGDTLTYIARVESYLVGENLAAGFTAAFADGFDSTRVSEPVISAASIDGSLRSTTVNNVAVMPALTGTNQGVTECWDVEVSVTVLGTLDWVCYIDSRDSSCLGGEGGGSAGSQWAGADIDLQLVQVRFGDGFVDLATGESGGGS